MNKYAVTPVNEARQFVEADKMQLGDKSVTLFVGDQVKAHFPHIESVVVDLAAPPIAPGSFVSVVGELGAAPIRRLGSPLSDAIESAALLVADLEQMPVAGPKHLTVHGRIAAHLDLLLAEQAGSLCRPIASAPTYAP